VDRLEFYRQIILEALNDLKGDLGDLRFRIYSEAVKESMDVEELRELADLELEIDLFKYSRGIKERLRLHGSSIDILREESGIREVESIFIEEEEPSKSLTEEVMEIREAADSLIVDMEDIKDVLEFDFEVEDEDSLDGEDEYGFEVEDEDSLDGEDEDSLDGEDEYGFEVEDEDSLDGEDEYGFEVEDEDSLDGEDEYGFEVEDEDSLDGEDEYGFEVEDEDSIDGEDEYGFEDGFDIEDEDGFDIEDGDSLDGEDEYGFEVEDEDGFDIEDEYGFEVEGEESLEGEDEYGFEDPVDEINKLGEGYGFNRDRERDRERLKGGRKLEERGHGARDIRKPSEERRLEDREYGNDSGGIKRSSVFNTKSDKGRKNQDMLDALTKGFSGTAGTVKKAKDRLGKLRESDFFKLEREEDDDEPIVFK